MAVYRISGHHEKVPGVPTRFRTTTGSVLDHGREGAEIEARFSRKGETANLDAVKAQHSDAVAKFDAEHNTSIHITNNSPAIFRLNEGWSAQTNAGFFERAVEEARSVIAGLWKF